MNLTKVDCTDLRHRLLTSVRIPIFEKSLLLLGGFFLPKIRQR